jgi:hypothetical protein
MENTTCRHCKAELAGEDIYVYFLKQTGDPKIALEKARSFDWCEHKKYCWMKTSIVQNTFGRDQWIECVLCRGKDPLNDGNREYNLRCELCFKS